MKRSQSKPARASVVFALALVVSFATASVADAPRKAPSERLTRTIAIVINGEPLETSNPPIVLDGRLLVPIREVFAALGIIVTRSGDTISMRLPNGNAKVVVGNATVSIDGNPVALDAPVVDTNGTTYGSLKLIVATLGAQATYDQRGANVQIVSAFIGRNGRAQQQRDDGGSDVQGVVSALDLDSVPASITVERGGTARTIAMTSSAKIWTEDVTIHTQLRGALADIRVGDALHAILSRDGRVVSLFDFYKSTNGKIAAASASSIVLANGHVVTPSGVTQISRDDQPATLADLVVGDFVTVRSNPESGELRAIAAIGPAAGASSSTPTTSAKAAGAAVAISSVALSAQRPLRIGETFTVTLHGTPGGRASFDIGDYLTDRAMRETAPGSYVGQFTIPDRFNVSGVPIYGKLAVGASSAPRLATSRTLSATTVAPTIGEVAPPPGQTVNNARPSVFATFSAPTEIGINATTATVTINGRDVTPDATRTSGFITYSPDADYPDGPVTVVVRVADAAGNASSKSWTFGIKTR